MSDNERKDHEEQGEEVEAHNKHGHFHRNDSEPVSKEDASDEVEAHMKHHKDL
jgi:hypothetical protein